MCPIDGNIATNTGGINVIQYGLTRNWVYGLLKVKTGNGDILPSETKVMLFSVPDKNYFINILNYFSERYQ